jgi:F-type H+-transporting ATPase subunit delta
MAELATIARPYAEALFQAVQAQPAAESLEHVAQSLDTLAVIARNSQIRNLAGDPQFSADRLGTLLMSAMPQQPGTAVHNLLQVVLENRRLAALPEIAEQFHQLKDAAQHRAEALISSAFPLEPAQLEALLPSLERKFGCKLYPRVEIDPSLIGGVRVAVGDEVLDTSVRARLDAMRIALTA